MQLGRLLVMKWMIYVFDIVDIDDDDDDDDETEPTMQWCIMMILPQENTVAGDCDDEHFIKRTRTRSFWIPPKFYTNHIWVRCI